MHANKTLIANKHGDGTKMAKMFLFVCDVEAISKIAIVLNISLPSMPPLCQSPPTCIRCIDLA